MPFETTNPSEELRAKARDMFPHDETLARSTYHWNAADEIDRLRAALEQCGKPFRVSDNNIKIPWELLAREFNDRQALAIEALGANGQQAGE
jgi:hypothetical protein